MTDIYLIRHGESAQQGDDIALTNQGLLQARKTAERLLTLNISKVYTSDLTRAAQTCQEFQKRAPTIPIVKTEKLREIYRRIIGGPEREGTPQNREEEDKKRADSFLKELQKTARSEERIAVFTHGNFIRYILAKAIHAENVNLWDGMVVSEGSISLLEMDGEKWTIKMVNNIDHLDEKSLKEFYFYDNKNSKTYF